MVRLIWCKYSGAKGHSNRLFLELGQTTETVYVLDTKLLGEGEVTMIRQAASQLNKLESITDIVEWLKERIPTAMVAMKSLKAERILVYSIRDLKPL